MDSLNTAVFFNGSLSEIRISGTFFHDVLLQQISHQTATNTRKPTDFAQLVLFFCTLRTAGIFKFEFLITRGNTSCDRLRKHEFQVCEWSP